MQNSFRFLDLLYYFLKLGAFKFGGPPALVHAMKQDLIIERKWFSQRDFNMGLSLAQMAPGPLASQLAIYFGWKKKGVWGAAFVLTIFVAPSFVLVCWLAHYYNTHQQLSWLKATTTGASGCVMALMLRGAFSLAQGTNFRNPVQLLILMGSAIFTVLFQSEIAWIFLVAGLLSWWHASHVKNKSLKSLFFLPLVFGLFQANTAKAGLSIEQVFESLHWKMFRYFFETGALVFGSGSVIIPFLYAGVVSDFHWLTEKQFLDALLVGMITPGPVVITVAFVGYLVSGLSGALVSLVGIFLPCFLFVVIPAPFFEKLSHKGDFEDFIHGLSIAASGAILGAAWLVAQKTLTTPLTLGVFFACLLTIWKFKRIPDPLLILASALVGYVFI
jgi:chromate transporter